MAIVSASFVLRLLPLAGLFALLSFANVLPIVFAGEELPEVVEDLSRVQLSRLDCIDWFIYLVS